MALVHSSRIACDARGVGRGGRRASARSRTSDDRRRPAAGDRHDDPAGLARLRLARNRRRPRALRRPRAPPLRALAHGERVVPGNYVWQVVEDADSESLDRDQRRRRREMGPRAPTRSRATATTRTTRSSLASDRVRTVLDRCARPRLDRHVRCRRRRARPGPRAESSTCVTTRTMPARSRSDASSR